MHYQVVAKSAPAGADHALATWEYYPYWAPGRDRGAAERLAVYAAQNGREAAILQGASTEVLEAIARPIVENQAVHLLPAVRYVPGARVARHDGWSEHTVETSVCPLPNIDPDEEGPIRFELDKRRLELELGHGGDITRGGDQRFDRVQHPQRMEVLSVWVRLRERVERGQLGGRADGAGE